ncbi:MAG: hypothetical protein WA152_03585 [Microgenomates group bacterium]
MTDRIISHSARYPNLDCEWKRTLKFSVNLVRKDHKDTSSELVVRDGQLFTCKKRSPKGGKIEATGNIARISFTGCDGCIYFKKT